MRDTRLIEECTLLEDEDELDVRNRSLGRRRLVNAQLNSTHSLMRKDLTGHTGPNGHLHAHNKN